ncbi:hypothetical protein DFJ74DRAFT_652475 [Hyaloraphidium curvatum]|nr:hypothetical protein DFJ74DRAFT_652475 [Hyaloraphidium curvatum]
MAPRDAALPQKPVDPWIPEIFLRIAGLLDLRSILRVASASRRLRDLASDAAAFAHLGPQLDPLAFLGPERIGEMAAGRGWMAVASDMASLTCRGCACGTVGFLMVPRLERLCGDCQIKVVSADKSLGPKKKWRGKGAPASRRKSVPVGWEPSLYFNGFDFPTTPSIIINGAEAGAGDRLRELLSSQDNRFFTIGIRGQVLVEKELEVEWPMKLLGLGEDASLLMVWSKLVVASSCVIQDLEIKTTCWGPDFDPEEFFHAPEDSDQFAAIVNLGYLILRGCRIDTVCGLGLTVATDATRAFMEGCDVTTNATGNGVHAYPGCVFSAVDNTFRENLFHIVVPRDATEEVRDDLVLRNLMDESFAGHVEPVLRLCDQEELPVSKIQPWTVGLK